MILFTDDISCYRKKNFQQQLWIEKFYFKSFQHIDYSIYKQERINHLNKINESNILNHLIDYLHVFQPKIAVFPGSFNPFHKGHYNILQKAERIFDKVIIAFGENPDKPTRTFPIPYTIQNRQIEFYNTLLTDFLKSLNYDVMVIRGLRNSTDFHYEQNQYRYMQELYPKIKIVNIFCDKIYEHISSSGIRTLQKYNQHQPYLLP
ncbi:MAG: adenylyltransferase/cytidyltransferase family protein [Bacteroidia bacterium]|nr:adenylyltransferase/cytidyltransferase family protein [Bacteroidia bacterium]